MKILTLTQPWASLVALGEKKIETRGWDTDYRGELAIHAAKGFPKDQPESECRELCEDEDEFRDALARHGLTFNDLPRGKVVAVADLADTVSTNTQRARDIARDCPHETEFGNFGPDRHLFLLANLRRLAEPVPVRGGLGLRDMDPDDVVRVRAAMEPPQIVPVVTRALSTPNDPPPIPAQPLPRFRVAEAPADGVVHHHLGGRGHLVVEAGDAPPAGVSGAVVRVLVRRGEDGARARRALLDAGADHVVVAPVPSDQVAEPAQREVMADDPVAALREYAKRDPLPAGADLDALAAEVFR